MLEPLENWQADSLVTVALHFCEAQEGSAGFVRRPTMPKFVEAEPKEDFAIFRPFDLVSYPLDAWRESQLQPMPHP